MPRSRPSPANATGAASRHSTTSERVLSERAQSTVPRVHFRDLFVYREDFYSIGVEMGSGRFYLSIPVSNRLVDYEEYYEIDLKMLDAFLDDPAKARAFADRARNREEDARLLVPPPPQRGTG